MKNFVDYYIKYTERLKGINESALSAPEKLISQMERQYRKRIFEIAEFVSEMGCGHKILMVAGPSSSGKTTTSAILCEELGKLGIGVLQISLDDFFLGKENKERLPDGSVDYESVKALDIDLMQQCLLNLIASGETDLPRFDFHTSSRMDEKKHVTIGKNDVVVVEGIHALNPIITTNLPDRQMLKMYISVKQGIKQGDDEVLSASDIRLIRRIVRDSKFRNATPEKTFNMWSSVCDGERKYIAPYKRLADITINTIHIYEPCIFRDDIIDLLSGIGDTDVHYDMANHLIRGISRFEKIDKEFVPRNSMLREFIGGGIYS